MKQTPSQPTSDAEIDYNQLSRELTEVLDRLEGGELDIDEAVESYDRGLQIVSLLENRLLKAENRVSQLRATQDETDAEEDDASSLSAEEE